MDVDDARSWTLGSQTYGFDGSRQTYPGIYLDANFPKITQGANLEERLTSSGPIAWQEKGLNCFQKRGKNIHSSGQLKPGIQTEQPRLGTTFNPCITDLRRPNVSWTGGQCNSPLEGSGRQHNIASSLQKEYAPPYYPYGEGHSQEVDQTNNSMQPDTWIRELPFNFPRQNERALPYCRDLPYFGQYPPNIPEDPPPVPTLIHYEPRTEPHSRRGTRSEPKRRRRSTTESRSSQVDTARDKNKRPRPKPGPKFQIFKSNNMTEVKTRHRYLSASQRERAAFVRKHGACKTCRREHRACKHAGIEPMSPGSPGPITPNADESMDISVYSPPETPEIAW